MTPRLQKDTSIIRVVDGLRARLGSSGFEIVDHWPSDLYAIGIARPDSHGVLVHVCTYGSGANSERWRVNLELPPEAGGEMPYAAAGGQEVNGVDELASVVRRHFQRPANDA